VDVSYDERKLTELIVHVAEQLMTDSFGGATKLNKVLYFADFAHVRKHGRPLTGAEYFKLPHGPAPRRMKPIRDRLVSTRQAELRAEQLVGHRQDRLIPLRSADSSVFTDVELETIGEVILARARVGVVRRADRARVCADAHGIATEFRGLHQRSARRRTVGGAGSAGSPTTRSSVRCSS
jgi:hypothetical protein